MLGYSYIDWQGPVEAPEPSLNGGLFTGAPFKPGAPWGNIPVKPDAVSLSQNLKTANPPPRAMEMLPSYTRPGNNHVDSPYHTVYHEGFPNLKVTK